MIRYNELAKVSAVETFRNGIGGFKVDERVVSFRSPTKCLALEIIRLLLSGTSPSLRQLGLGLKASAIAKPMEMVVAVFSRDTVPAPHVG